MNVLTKINPLQGEVWLFDPDPVKGREIGKKVRPALVVSSNLLNRGASGLVIVVPVTIRDKGIPSHVRILLLQGGVKVASFAVCEHIRSISKDRLMKRLGCIQSQKILGEVYSWLTDLIWMN